MNTYNPDSERQARHARRDCSPIPLSDIEHAERRHHVAQRYWGYVYMFAPTGVLTALGLLFYGFFPFAVAAVLAFWVALFVSDKLDKFLSAHVRAWPGMWLTAHMVGHAVVGGALTLVLAGADLRVVSGMFDGSVWGVVITIAMTAWPWAYARLRTQYPTDYERHLAGSNAPQHGIME